MVDKNGAGVGLGEADKRTCSTTSADGGGVGGGGGEGDLSRRRLFTQREADALAAQVAVYGTKVARRFFLGEVVRVVGQARACVPDGCGVQGVVRDRDAHMWRVGFAHQDDSERLAWFRGDEIEPISGAARGADKVFLTPKGSPPPRFRLGDRVCSKWPGFGAGIVAEIWWSKAGRSWWLEMLRDGTPECSASAWKHSADEESNYEPDERDLRRSSIGADRELAREARAAAVASVAQDAPLMMCVDCRRYDTAPAVRPTSWRALSREGASSGSMPLCERCAVRRLDPSVMAAPAPCAPASVRPEDMAVATTALLSLTVRGFVSPNEDEHGQVVGVLAAFFATHRRASLAAADSVGASGLAERYRAAIGFVTDVMRLEDAGRRILDAYAGRDSSGGGKEGGHG